MKRILFFKLILYNDYEQLQTDSNKVESFIIQHDTLDKRKWNKPYLGTGNRSMMIFLIQIRVFVLCFSSCRVLLTW